MPKRVISIIRLCIGFAWVAACLSITVLVMVPFAPWRVLRIKITNYAGTVMGRGVIAVWGGQVTVRGREALHPDKPVIYVGNHTSALDAFTSIWLCPQGTVGVAKKQIVYYPFYGQVWLLSGHLLLDRGNSARARASFRSLAEFVGRHGLHVCMWPEGTRSPDGRLLPFKKGVVHLAVQTGLDVVPMVIVGAHRAWTKSTLTVRPVQITVTFLPRIETSTWELSRIDEHLAQVRRAFVDNLPAEQQPAKDTG